MTETAKGYIIAIDGPVAAGKGTLAPLLAQKLHGFLLPTGAMYRCVALYCIENKIDWQDDAAVVAVLPAIAIDLQEHVVLLNGRDVSERIKKEDISQGSSRVAVIPEVRAAMVAIQQSIGEKAAAGGKIVIAEGRDTGTRVFPHARLKLFVTASVEERAKRRLAQIEARGDSMSLAQVIEEIKKRDTQDTERTTDPLVKEPEKHGYFVLDNTHLTEDETLGIILAELKKRI